MRFFFLLLMLPSFDVRSRSSSGQKKTLCRSFASSWKKSAMVMDTPPKILRRDATDGLFLFCSIIEISPCVTPARLASSLCERPAAILISFNRAPTSKSICSLIFGQHRLLNCLKF
jgi:hypothetical protein